MNDTPTVWCWGLINRKAIAGVDGIDAQAYGENLLLNIEQLVKQVNIGLDYHINFT